VSEEAVKAARWLLPFTRRIAECFYGTGAASPDDGSVKPYAALKRAYKVSCEAYDSLEEREKNPGFESAGELCEFACELFEATFGNPDWKEPEEFARRLAALLIQPLEPFQFDFDIGGGPGHHQDCLEMLLAGPYALRLEPLGRGKEFRGLRVHGIVQAGTADDAVPRAERVLDELCGAFISLGLATFSPPVRSKVHEATVRIRGGKARGQPHSLDPSSAYRALATTFVVPRDLTDLERRLVERGDVEHALDRYDRLLERLFQSESIRARELRAACRRAVQASTSTDFGLCITLAFSCLEGLLLDPKSKADVLSRIVEAVAHGLGRSSQERSDLRARVKKLYELRSVFVHTGNAQESVRARAQVLDLAYRVIRREVELLDPDRLVAGSEGVPQAASPPSPRRSRQ
jgi:hypothetical protein